MSKLKDVVTGASKGIGAGIAKALASEGAAVVVNYSSNKEGADKVVAEITANGGKAIAVQTYRSRPTSLACSRRPRQPSDVLMYLSITRDSRHSVLWRA